MWNDASLETHFVLKKSLEFVKLSPSFFDELISDFLKNKQADSREVSLLLKKFAQRAFRYQGVSDAFIKKLVDIYELEKATGAKKEEAIVTPLATILSSPAFLYLKEKNDGKRKVLTQHELAIRMAFFLWSSPPDEELYQLAREGKLFDRSTLKQQFDRMIDSPKADRFQPPKVW